MPIRVTVSTSGIPEILERIGGLEERLADLRPAFGIIADLLQAFVAKQFATQGVFGGTPWSPLMPRTVLARARRWGYYRNAPLGEAGPSRPILVWTGRLRSSFAAGAAEHVRIIDQDGLSWGSRARQAGPLHRQRPILAFRDDFQRREIAFQPLRLWLQGVPEGAIRTVMQARLGLGAVS